MTGAAERQVRAISRSRPRRTPDEVAHQAHRVRYSLDRHWTRFQDNPAMLKTLPFDTDTMLARLKPWIECESPTYDAAAVNRIMDLAAYDLAAAGAEIDRIPGRMGFGGSVRARF